ncbi:MAG: DUF488 family protein [Xanthobacteraceae bacterium]|jgi:uncharacterized protein YeaO (DUF488 family)
MTGPGVKRGSLKRSKTPSPKRRSRPGSIAIKRAYDAPAAKDGLRILIDRLWPRGISKAKLRLDAWPRAIAPSTPLRKWYGHDPQRYAEFRRRYRAELAEHKDELAALRSWIGNRAATLITATRDLALSHAEVLREMLSTVKR